MSLLVVTWFSLCFIVAYVTSVCMVRWEHCCSYKCRGALQRIADFLDISGQCHARRGKYKQPRPIMNCGDEGGHVLMQAPIKIGMEGVYNLLQEASTASKQGREIAIEQALTLALISAPSDFEKVQLLLHDCQSQLTKKKAWISCLRACFVVSRREACTTSSRTFGRPWTTWSFLDQERRL